MTSLARDEENIDIMRHYLEQIQVSSDFMLGLLNNILDMAKIESKKITLNEELYPFEEFDSYLAAVVQPLFDQRGIELEKVLNVYDDVVMVTDKLRLNQVFFNLLSNAAKYTHEGGKVQLIINEIDKDSNTVTYGATVADNGIGMSEEFQKHIFETFTQEDNPMKDVQATGTGLGMAIVKRIIDFMGGSIEVHSELSKGTTFYLTLCCRMVKRQSDEYKKYVEERKRLTQSKKIVFKGKRVLLCEDNNINMTISKMLMEKIGVIVECAADGDKGVEMFKNSPINYYDAVLMDIRMPRMDGFEATRIIRALDRDDALTTPIIAMTANAFAEDRKASMDAGMNAHLSKPIKPEILYYTLNQYL